MLDFTENPVDVVVIGGGLAGLTAAVAVARGGRSVMLLEKSSHLGGRAGTHVNGDIHFNLGPHALYCGGRAFALLNEFGVPFSGQIPGGGHAALGFWNGRLTPLPLTLRTILTSRQLSIREKWRLLRFLSALPKIDSQSLNRTTLRQWIDQVAGTGNLASVIQFLFRLTTFSDDPDCASAGAAIQQLQIGLKGNVWYLDGGWRTLVDGLARRAGELGADLRTSSSVQSLEEADECVRVVLRGGETILARTAILAVTPQSAVRLANVPEDSELGRFAAEARPVTAACLDVALLRLPFADRTAVFGIDQPLYYSVHSASAKLAPPGVAVIHVMKYLGTSDLHSEHVQAELTGLLDLTQPGWRDQVIDQRFLPRMTVASSLATAAEGGLEGWPRVTMPHRENLFLAGDWVGSEGMLADAAVSSGNEAARAALVLLNQGMRLERSGSHAGG